jgi:hypothetical protein
MFAFRQDVETCRDTFLFHAILIFSMGLLQPGSSVLTDISLAAAAC